MKNTAFIFPDQGTQYVGMGSDIVKKYKDADLVYKEANEIMGIDIRKLCFEGPETATMQRIMNPLKIYLRN